MTTTKQSAYDYIGGDAVIRRKDLDAAPTSPGLVEALAEWDLLPR